MRRCLHAKHMDDRMKVRHAGARLAAHVLGATAANRLHRAFLPMPLSPCLVRCVGSSLCVCSHRGDQNDKPADGRLRARWRRRACAHRGHALGHHCVRPRPSGYHARTRAPPSSVHQGDGRRALSRVDRGRDRPARDRPVGGRPVQVQIGPTRPRPACPSPGPASACRPTPASERRPTPVRGTVRARGTQLEHCYMEVGYCYDSKLLLL